MATPRINPEAFLRVWYVSKYGRREHRNGALARLQLLREALRLDHRFPSSQPVLPAIETECWTWWHQVDEESSQAPKQEPAA